MLGAFFTCAFRQFRLVPNFAPSDFLIAVALLTVYFDPKNKLNGRKLFPFLIFSLFLYIYFLLMSLAVANNPSSSMINFTKILFVFTFVPTLLRIYLKNYYQVNELFWAMFCGVLVSNIVDLVITQGRVDARSSAFTGHPVYNGVLIGLSLAGIASFNYKTFRSKMLSIGSGIALLFALVRTASTTGLLILVAFCCIYVLTRFSLQRLLQSFFSLLAMMLLMIFFAQSDVFSDFRYRLTLTVNPRTGYSINPREGVSTLDARISSLQASWDRIQQSPLLGHGLDLDGRMTSVALEPHNFFLIGWQTGGIVLFILTVVVFIYSCIYFFKSISRKATLEASMIAGSWIALLSGPLVYERSILAPLFLALLSPRLKH